MNDYFEGCLSLNEAKQRYLAIANEYHPAKGQDPIQLFMARLEFQQLARDPVYAFNQSSQDVQADFLNFPDVVDKLIGWRLTVEMIGSWLWVTGNTYPQREALKKMNFIYEEFKRAWYYRPASYWSSNSKPLPMEKIRALYGRNPSQSLILLKNSEKSN